MALAVSGLVVWAAMLYVALLALCWPAVGGEDVFASSAHMKIVAMGERNMMQAVEEYIRQERERLGNITR